MRSREAVEVEGIEVNGPTGSDFGTPGGAELESSPFQPGAMVDSIGDRFAAIARDKGISLEVKTAATVPQRLVGNRRGLDEALSALIDNAIRFTETGEIVTSVTCERPVGDRTLMYVEVSDTGKGIPDETLERLFDSAHDRPPDAAADAGGLIRSRRLVELMDGRFGASSEIGTGTTVWFTVPLDLLDE